MLVNPKSMLRKARKHKFAIGAFNVNNMETIQGVIEACEELKAPVILQTTESAIKYAGLEYLYAMLKVASKTNVSVAIHLDHGKSIETVKKCVKIGYTSVMIDGSMLPYKQNVKITKKAVKLARRYGVHVEGEIGKLAGYTEPEEAKRFVEETGVDALAVAIGTRHGYYKARINFPLLKEISELVSIPLVLHGSTGVSDRDLKRCIKYGIAKINCDTELRMAFMKGLRRHISETDYRIPLNAAREEVKKVVKRRVKLYNSMKFYRV